MPTILAIDDKPDNLLSLSALLTGMIPECEVITASSGKEGLEKSKTEKPDTIILDINMPVLDGFETCRVLKSKQDTKHIPVIMLTAVNTDSASRVKGLELGADAFLTKPINQFELSAQVKAMLRIKMAEDNLRKKSEVLEKQVTIRTAELTGKHKQLEAQIEERRQVEEALRASEEKYRTMMEAQEDAIYICSADFRVEYMNPAMIKRSGGDYTGEYCYKVIHKLNEKCPWCIHDKVINGESINTEVLSPRDKKTYNVTNSPIVHIDGSVSKLSVYHDVSKIKQMEEEKSNLLMQLTMADKMASIGQLASGVAHEINNPVGFVTSNLNSLDGYLSDLKELINLNSNLVSELKDVKLAPAVAKIKETIESFARDNDLEFLLEDISEIMGDCKEGLDRIKKIVIDLKNFAHPGKEKPELININDGLESTLNVVSNELKYKATVTKELGETAPVMAVPQQINQVFLNILVNAAQAMDEMGEINIKSWHDKTHTFVTISDTGCGISQENINKIFDPFFTTKKMGEGTGLGMNIAYNIIQKHKGTINIESTPGKGTTFTISLPAVQEDL